MPPKAKKIKLVKTEPVKPEPASGDDSDSSGPTDRNPPQKRKSADAPATSSSCPHRIADSDGQPTWKLDTMRSVSVSEFKGKTYVNLREFYEKDGKRLPGKKGIALTRSQWNALAESAADISAVLAEKS